MHILYAHKKHHVQTHFLSVFQQGEEPRLATGAALVYSLPELWLSYGETLSSWSILPFKSCRARGCGNRKQSTLRGVFTWWRGAALTSPPGSQFLLCCRLHVGYGFESRTQFLRIATQTQGLWAPPSLQQAAPSFYQLCRGMRCLAKPVSAVGLGPFLLSLL